MDCDLQDQPEEIEKLYRKARKATTSYSHGAISGTIRSYRKVSSSLFSLLYNYLGDIKVDNSVANFSISSRRVIAYVRQFRERNRCLPDLPELGRLPPRVTWTCSTRRGMPAKARTALANY